MFYETSCAFVYHQALVREYKTRKFRKTSYELKFILDSSFHTIIPKTSTFGEKSVYFQKIDAKITGLRDIIVLLFTTSQAKMCETGVKSIM